MLKIQARPEDGEPMRTRRVGAMLTALLLAMGLALTVASPAGATFPGGNGLVLFTRGGNLYTATSTGGSIKQLTTTADIAGPKWSPDGKSITYRRGTSVYVRPYPTGTARAVATGVDGNPEWSPDGTKIAYLATRPDDPDQCGEQAVYTVPTAGGVPSMGYNYGLSQASCADGPPLASVGTYLPDGRILLTLCDYKDGDGYCEIYVATMDGTNTLTGVVSVSCYGDDALAGLCSNIPNLSDARTRPSGSGIVFDGRGGYEPNGTGTLPGSVAAFTSSTPERVYAVDLTGANLHSVSTAASGYNPTRAPTGSTVLFTQKSGSTTNLMKSTTAATSTASVFIKNASQADWQPTH